MRKRDTAEERDRTTSAETLARLLGSKEEGSETPADGPAGQAEVLKGRQPPSPRV